MYARLQFSYRTACIGAIARLKKRGQADSADEAGTLEQYDKRMKELELLQKTRLTTSKALQLTMDEDMLKAYDYFTEVPPEEGGVIPTEEGRRKVCDRCNTTYTVTGWLSKVR